MSNQTKLAVVGGTAFAIAKLYYKTDFKTASFYGLGAMSLVALFTAKNTTS